MKVFAGGQHLSPVYFPSLVVWVSFDNTTGASTVKCSQISLCQCHGKAVFLDVAASIKEKKG